VARTHAIPGYEVVEGKVEDEMARVLPADLVLLNPPRTGLHPSLTLLLKGGTVERMIYVSCDPATLARDLERLGTGFRLERVVAFDLFPQTAHVETVVTLTRKGNESP
jgi:tRNA/tmRNA/rRNA uracil-C5-methylase (TrmA/RlmC/RlmD family)